MNANKSKTVICWMKNTTILKLDRLHQRRIAGTATSNAQNVAASAQRRKCAVRSCCAVHSNYRYTQTLSLVAWTRASNCWHGVADQMHQHSSTELLFGVCICASVFVTTLKSGYIWLTHCASDVHNCVAAAVALFVTISWPSTSSNSMPEPMMHAA